MKIINKNAFRPRIAHVLLFYWVVLVAWQNITRIEARSGADLAIKIILISVLTGFYALNAKTVSRNMITVFVFAIVLVFSMWFSKDTFSTSNIIAYLYPVLFAALSFGVGNDFEIDKKDFLFFLKGIILVVMYMAGYSILFCTEHFTGAFANGSGYGVELCSFFTSSHEYGMYLVYAITACIICIEMEKDDPKKKRRPYLLAIIIFAVNLVLTYSRTSLLAMSAIIFVYCFTKAGTKLRKWMIITVVCGVVAFVASSGVRELIDIIMFKGKDSIFGVREELFSLAINLFKDGSMSEKIFGYGLKIRNVFEHYARHGSVHNAYLQVLLYHGIAGAAFFVGMLISQLIEAIKLYKVSKMFSVNFCIFILAAMTLMMTNTAIVFTSPIDSFFLTIVAILVPKYVRNSIYAGTFDTR